MVETVEPADEVKSGVSVLYADEQTTQNPPRCFSLSASCSVIVDVAHQRDMTEPLERLDLFDLKIAMLERKGIGEVVAFSMESATFL